MTQAEFVRMLGRHLLRRDIPYDPAELREFTRDVWPVARQEPGPRGWALVFLALNELRRGHQFAAAEGAGR
jgi:hypothetical protein